MEKSIIEKLLALNVNEHTDKKNNLTYLSWSWAWAEMIKLFPEATYTVSKNTDGLPVFGNEKMGYMCYTTVTAGGITHEMWLPVMNHMNKAILQPNMFEINKTVMRCLTKNLAMFGLGLYIYAGEDLPEGEEQPTQQQPKRQQNKPTEQPKEEAPPVKITEKQSEELVTLCAVKGASILKYLEQLQLEKLADMTDKQYLRVKKHLEDRKDAQ